jgi:hypothetical protein
MRGENGPIASWTATRVTVRTRVVSDTIAVAKEDRIVCASDDVPIKLCGTSWRPATRPSR